MYTLCFWVRDNFVVWCSLYCSVYRIPSAFPERKPYATCVHQLVKATSFMLTKENAKGHVGLTSTICRNFEIYQNDTKIRRKLAYEMYSCLQLLGASTQAPWPGALPLDPAGGYRARHSPPNAKTKLRLWPWVTSDPDFKITTFFDIQYLRNDQR